ncbi:Prephenate dehydratase-domain-containing protein [Phlebopus sp. FC_14]|nr:Prephenate dehydratase-domain-containing protein [Phlebopus sp. FC_14]
MFPATTSTPQKPKVAFLGPLGTYSHQAAYECFGSSVDYVPQTTIADVQQSLSTDVPFGIVPQENSIYGSVVETYNLLRNPAVGEETFVRGVTLLAIQHCLIVRRGVRIDDIKHVLSHEQALGQCRSFLAQRLPHASLVPTDSTASAAEKLVSEGPIGLDPFKCAAICSSVVVTIFQGLEVLQNAIQDEEANFTRFFILSYGLDEAVPPARAPASQHQALLRIYASPDAAISTKRLDVTEVVSTLNLSISRMDRRPSLKASAFDDVYFLEVGSTHMDEVTAGSPWADQLQRALNRVKHIGAEGSVIGFW